MALKPYTFSDEDRASISNALRAAANRWDEWADNLALPEIAQRFRDQAATARRQATLFDEAYSADLYFGKP